MKGRHRSKAYKKLARVALTGGLVMLSGHQAKSQTVEASNKQDDTLEEVMVTASRRKTDIVEIPYNISAYSGAALEATNVNNMADLAQQVPGFNLEDRGARDVGASIPIIRGINASDPNRSGSVQVLEQSPVATYLGNTAIEPYFPIDDIQRVEVLRGPQGTLYGAGALGGAIRLIPNDPQLDTWAGNITATTSGVDHATTPGYSGAGLINAPIGEIAALRISAKYDYDPGFIKQIGIMEVNPASGVPLLANPADVADSPAIYYSQKGVNYTETTSGRASLLVEPRDGLSINIAFNTATYKGNGSPQDNPDFAGGPSTIDPRISFPAAGEYQIVQPTLEPYRRESHLTTADESFDVGFATLSSTSSYFDTDGRSQSDNSIGFLISSAAAGYGQYYYGTPVGPRFVQPSIYLDTEHNFTQELRLVSTPGKVLDYVVGLYYQNYGRNAAWIFEEPGVAAQTVASGSPIAVIDNGEGVLSITRNKEEFSDKSVYGELTWHITDRWQTTFGGREFHQDFTSTQGFVSYTLFINFAGGNSTATTDHIVKLNTSYEYVDGHRVYGTYSQGFRRGGANGFPSSGFAQEPAAIDFYKPDKVDNFEVGFKGRFENGMRYSADIFDIVWHDPQIGLDTYVGNIAVVNGQEAVSRGVELELNTPLFTPGLNLTFGYSYTEAKLTKNFCLPDGDGSGAPNGFLPCGIQGIAGEAMPGSPKSVASATLSYTHPFMGNGHLIYTFNEDYKSAISETLGSPEFVVPSYALANASVTWAMQQHWRVGAYSTNLMNRRAIYAEQDNPLLLDNPEAHKYTVSRPREIGLRVSYDF